MHINIIYYIKMTEMTNKQLKWYVVVNGRVPGIYTDWDETKKQVDGFCGAIFKLSLIHI